LAEPVEEEAGGQEVEALAKALNPEQRRAMLATERSIRFGAELRQDKDGCAE